MFSSGEWSTLPLTCIHSTVSLSRHWHLIVTCSPSHTLTLPRLQNMIVVLLIFCSSFCCDTTSFWNREGLPNCIISVNGTTRAVVVCLHICVIHWIVHLTFCRLPSAVVHPGLVQVCKRSVNRGCVSLKIVLNVYPPRTKRYFFQFLLVRVKCSYKLTLFVFVCVSFVSPEPHRRETSQ